MVEAIHARPEGMPIAGIALHPDIMGIRPLFDDLCRRLATHGFAVCAPEPFTRAPADVRGGRRRPRPDGRLRGSMDDERPARRPRGRGRLPGRPRRRRAGGGHGLLHGRHADPQGRGRRPLRPGGGVLRDDRGRPSRCGARRCAGRSTPRPTWCRPSRSSVGSTRWSRRPTSRRCGRPGPTGPTARSWCTPTPTTGSATIPARPVHRPDDAADAWERGPRRGSPGSIAAAPRRRVGRVG